MNPTGPNEIDQRPDPLRSPDANKLTRLIQADLKTLRISGESSTERLVVDAYTVWFDPDNRKRRIYLLTGLALILASVILSLAILGGYAIAELAGGEDLTPLTAIALLSALVWLVLGLMFATHLPQNRLPRQFAVRGLLMAYVWCKWQPDGDLIARGNAARMIRLICPCILGISSRRYQDVWGMAGRSDRSRTHLWRATLYLQSLQTDLFLAGPETRIYIAGELAHALRAIIDGHYGELKLVSEEDQMRLSRRSIPARLRRLVLYGLPLSATLVVHALGFIFPEFGLVIASTTLIFALGIIRMFDSESEPLGLDLQNILDVSKTLRGK